LVLRVLVCETLHGADYFCFGVAMYEETVIDMFMCRLSHDILNSFWRVL
jgi:hypothetical protein